MIFFANAISFLCWDVDICVSESAQKYTVSKKQVTIHLTFDHNFSKCTSIFKTLSLTDSQGNSLCNHFRAFHLTYTMLLHYVVKLSQLLPVSMAYCMWDLRIHLARYEVTLTAHVWVLWLQNLENNAALLRRGSVMSVKWNSRWLKCNILHV